jgi:Na+/H+-dicarboxylate symporter
MMSVPNGQPARSITSVVGSIVGLALGLTLGVFAHRSPSVLVSTIAPYIGAVSTLWLNALTVLVLPLTIVNVIAAVVHGRDARGMGRLSLWAFILFVLALALGAAFTLLVVPPILSHLSVDPAIATSLAQSLPDAARAAASKPPLGTNPSDVVSFFIPRNLLKSAMNDELLPVLIFSIAFAFAVSRVKDPGRALLADGFRALSEAFFILVGWILRLMPVGAFALAFTFSAGAGTGVAGVLGEFVLVSCAAMLAFTIALYPLTALGGGVSMRRFAMAVLPAQLAAIATRSSIASLPSMLEGASRELRMEPVVANLALPLSVSVFKVNRTISSTVKMLFLAHLFGIAIGPVQIVTFTVTIMILSFTSLGVPGGGVAFKSMAAYLAVGLPIEGVVLLEAVDVVADIFKTLLNVTGDMSVAVLLARMAPRLADRTTDAVVYGDSVPLPLTGG